MTEQRRGFYLHAECLASLLWAHRGMDPNEAIGWPCPRCEARFAESEKIIGDVVFEEVKGYEPYD